MANKLAGKRWNKYEKTINTIWKGAGFSRAFFNILQPIGAALTIYHMNSLPAETRRKFTSDMGFVADYLNEGSFQGRGNQRILHPAALCKMMEALIGDARFTEQIKELIEKERKEEKVMM